MLCFFQPKCRLSEHFSQLLVQPLCYLAFKAAWRCHFRAIQARLLERAEYKRAESSVLENNTAIPPLPSQWPQLSPVTQLCYIHQLSLSETGIASQGSDMWGILKWRSRDALGPSGSFSGFLDIQKKDPVLLEKVCLVLKKVSGVFEDVPEVSSRFHWRFRVF